MTHKLIKTDNYLLVGSDDNIKRGCFYCVRTKNIFQDEGEDVHCCNGDIRIIAHLPLNGSPILEDVDLLPPYSRHHEDGLEELAEMNYPIDDWTEEQCLVRRLAFKAGYNKAREKYKYTEEDLRKAWNAAYTDALSIDEDTYEPLFFENYIQSLHQYPTEFECEMVDYCGSPFTTDRCPKCIDSCDRAYQRPKTITTAQGVQWVGKYK